MTEMCTDIQKVALSYHTKQMITSFQFRRWITQNPPLHSDAARPWISLQHCRTGRGFCPKHAGATCVESLLLLATLKHSRILILLIHGFFSWFQGFICMFFLMIPLIYTCSFKWFYSFMFSFGWFYGFLCSSDSLWFWSHAHTNKRMRVWGQRLQVLDWSNEFASKVSGNTPGKLVRWPAWVSRHFVPRSRFF